METRFDSQATTAVDELLAARIVAHLASTTPKGQDGPASTSATLRTPEQPGHLVG